MQNLNKNCFDRVPDDIRDYLVVEDVSDFPIDKYYFSDREKELFDYIVQNRKVAETFEKTGIKYLNATLLFGKSGTGKTTYGRFVAHKLNLPFAYLNFATVISAEYGGTSKNIGKIFDFINGKNCVFMLDEIDCVTRSRQTSGEIGSMENSRITITIMQELDKIANTSIILGGTNMARTLDPALVRRFTIIHEVQRFNTKEMKEFIIKFLDNIKIDEIKINYDENNIIQYCKQNSRLSQAIITNDIVRILAQCILTGEPFYLRHLDRED